MIKGRKCGNCRVKVAPTVIFVAGGTGAWAADPPMQAVGQGQLFLNIFVTGQALPGLVGLKGLVAVLAL